MIDKYYSMSKLILKHPKIDVNFKFKSFKDNKVINKMPLLHTMFHYFLDFFVSDFKDFNKFVELLYIHSKIDINITDDNNNNLLLILLNKMQNIFTNMHHSIPSDTDKNVNKVMIYNTNKNAYEVIIKYINKLIDEDNTNINIINTEKNTPTTVLLKNYMTNDKNIEIINYKIR